MVENRYEKHFSAATAAAGGTVGIIIPPSILFIVYGYLISLPISELFLAGVFPGILMVVAMMVALNALDGFDILSISFASPGIASDWQLDSHGACLYCGTPCAGHFAEQAGSWGSRRQAVSLAGVDPS